jgi:transposase InsO family protein
MSSSDSTMAKIKPLSNNNYPEWSGEMKAWLMRNGLWKLVSGKELKPTRTTDNAEAVDKWELKAEKAAGEIYLLVESDQRVHFRGSDENPVEMWKLLENAHLSKKPGARFNAYDDLFSIRKQDDETLVVLGIRIEKAMQAIQNLRPKDFKIETLDEELQCMAMIRALPEEYRHLSSSLLLMPKLDKATILQAFRSEELNRQRQIESLNSAKAGGAKKWEKRPQKTSTTKSTCFYCKKEGHWVQDCLKLKEKIQKIEAAEKTEEKVAVTEFAGKASAVPDNEVNSTSSNVFHWNTDTGATSSMTPHHNWIRNYTPYKVPIRLADHRIIYSEGVGTVRFRPVINGKQIRDVEFTRVLHVPALRNNLLAVLYLTKYKGIDVHISRDKMDFLENDTLRFRATISDDDIGYLDGSTIDITENVQLTSTLPLDLSLWHKRLGHHNYDDIKLMVSKDLVVGLTLDSKEKPDPICEPCLAGKMHANPFPSSEHRATEVLELIHSDVHEVGVKSHSGYNYWVTFVDDCGRYKAVMPMKHKSDTYVAFRSYKAWAENLTGKKIKRFRDDKGGEYMSNEFSAYLDACGIIREHSCRNRPQQNGVAERTNRLFAERIVALLNESGLSKQFWVECLSALVHVLNRCPTSAIKNKTPYETMHNRKPDVSHLRVWGCLAYVHIQKDKRAKLGSHMEKCIFIGYPEGYKGWKFYNPETQKVIICERADFDERYTYDGKLITTNTSINPEPRPLIPEEDSTEEDINPPQELEPEQIEQQEEEVPPVVEEEPAPVAPIPDNEPIDNRPIALRRAKRTVNPPGEWWKLPRQPAPMIPESDSEESDDEQEEVNACNNNPDPKSFEEAIDGELAEEWHDAMLDEFNWHLENGTWTLVELPDGKHAIGSGWVYRTKHLADGSVERYKARVVAKGFSQRPGQDFFETYASTMRSATIRIVLALAAIEDMEVHSIDISYAFTNSDIDVEIYMEQPQGFKQGGKKYVCRLNKALYGLKQAPRLWSETLAKVLLELGFKRTYSDASLYIYERDNIKVIVPVFVDDITLASKSQAAIDNFVVELGKHFKLRDLGKTNLLLGIEVSRNRAERKLYLSQRQYIVNKLEEFGMTDCKPVGTPMLPGLKLSKGQAPKTEEEKSAMENIPYINAVGSLMYLATMTRPDIAYTVGVLARFNSNPGMAHWKAVKHVFRYLKGSMNLKLEYGPDASIESDMFATYSDADHGGNKDSGKSTSGYMVKLGSGVVNWSSKQQAVVTRSTTEAEFIAAGAAGMEIRWMQNLLQELGYTPSAPAKLYMDNQSSMSVAKNPEHHGKMKHLDLCYYWLRDEVSMKRILPLYLQTENMPADLLTKALPKPQVEKLRSEMGLVYVKDITLGG